MKRTLVEWHALQGAATGCGLSRSPTGKQRARVTRTAEVRELVRVDYWRDVAQSQSDLLREV